MTTCAGDGIALTGRGAAAAQTSSCVFGERLGARCVATDGCIGCDRGDGSACGRGDEVSRDGRRRSWEFDGVPRIRARAPGPRRSRCNPWWYNDHRLCVARLHAIAKAGIVGDLCMHRGDCLLLRARARARSGSPRRSPLLAELLARCMGSLLDQRSPPMP